MNLYSSTIWRYENNPDSWEALQRHHTILADDLSQLMFTTESGEICKATDVTRAYVALAIAAKGFKI